MKFSPRKNKSSQRSVRDGNHRLSLWPGMSDRLVIKLRPSRRGSAMVMAVVFVTISAMVVAYVMQASNRQTRNTFRTRLFETSLAASATMVKAMTQQAYFMATSRPAQLSGNLELMDPLILSIKPKKIPGFVSVKHGSKDLTAFRKPVSGNGVWGVIDDPKDDWNGFAIRRWTYDAVSFLNENEKTDNTQIGPTAKRLGFEGAGFKANIQINYIPLYQYAIFYENDLEIHNGPKMDVLGPVHGNSTVWVATGDEYLKFHDRLSAAGNLRSERDFKALNPQTNNKAIGGNLAVNAIGHDMDAFHTKPVYVKKKGSQNLVALNDGLPSGADTNNNTFLDSGDTNWLSDALTRFGGNVTDIAMGNKPIRPPLPFVGEGANKKIADAGELIQRSNGNFNYQADPMEKLKMESMADIRITGDPSNLDNKGNFKDIKIEPAIHNSEGLVTGYGTPIPNQKLNNKGKPVGEPLVTPGAFVDNREGKTVYSFDIDMEQMSVRDSELGHISSGNGLIYVSTKSSGGGMNAVRLVNAADMPTSLQNTLTVATDRPMYLEGNINTENKATLLLAADAITVTSKHLTLDSNNQTIKDKAQATITNAIFMLGQVSSKYMPVDSTGKKTPGGKEINHFAPGYGRVTQSGGAHNVLRYLENWSGVKHTYNGSLICLFESRVATTKFGGPYYNPPNRDYNWDASLKNSSPPIGMPVLVEVKTSRLERISKAEAVALLQ